MRKILIIILLLSFNIQLAYAEDLSAAKYGINVKVESVIQDSNDQKDIGCSVVLHKNYNAGGSSNYLCYIFSPDGKKLRTIH
ncbi:MAG: hypothetical protein JSV30_03420 [Candidatus Omnitrophota bacterium]|nr:MAG: hypothetical protein JSV30_03420 [Candidatus Omnitrophota bacterium]